KCLRAEQQSDRCTRAGSVQDRRMAATFSNDVYDVFLHAVLYSHLTNFEPAILNDPWLGQRSDIQALEVMRIETRIPPRNDLALIFFARIIDQDLEQKTIKLRLGERGCNFVTHSILI